MRKSTKKHARKRSAKRVVRKKHGGGLGAKAVPPRPRPRPKKRK